MSVRSQGTELFFLAGDPATVMKMSCPTGVNGMGGTRDQIETTCLDDTEDHQYEAGLGTPGTVSVPFIFKPQEASQQELWNLRQSGEKISWMVCLSDGSGEPTEGGSGLSAPEGRTSLEFVAYVADLTIEVATNDVVRGTMELQRSGPVTPHWKS